MRRIKGASGECVHSRYQWKWMRTFKVDQENEMLPPARLHHTLSAHTHTHTHTHTLLPLLQSSYVHLWWPGGGCLLNQKESGGQRPRMGRVVRQLHVTWERLLTVFKSYTATKRQEWIHQYDIYIYIYILFFIYVQYIYINIYIYMCWSINWQIYIYIF